MEKLISLFIIVFFISFPACSQSTIEGLWATGKDNTTIEIRATDKVLEGKIKSSDNTKVELGKRIIKNLRVYNSSYKGELYIIKMQKWVNATFSPKGEKLTVTVSAGFRSKTIEWERVE